MKKWQNKKSIFFPPMGFFSKFYFRILAGVFVFFHCYFFQNICSFNFCLWGFCPLENILQHLSWGFCLIVGVFVTWGFCLIDGVYVTWVFCLTTKWGLGVLSLGVYVTWGFCHMGFFAWGLCPWGFFHMGFLSYHRRTSLYSKPSQEACLEAEVIDFPDEVG